MSHFVAVFDACVLYPASLRDLLVRLARTDLFRGRWSEQIHAEWTASLRRDRPDLDPKLIDRTRQLMDEAVKDALVTGHEPLIDGLYLPDPDDRHVLAAAIKVQAAVIVTFNLKDFPPETLGPLGIEAQHPDLFVRHLLDLVPQAVAQVVREQRAALQNPPMTARELLDTWLSLGMAETVAALSEVEASL